MKNIEYKSLAKEYQTLINEASKAMERSYCPYSGFSVGAALLTYDNIIIHGANFENAAYPSCICAEAAAIVSANAQGHRRFKAIAVIAKGKDFDTKEVGVPCGNCRQILYEASQIYNEPLDVIMSSTKMDKISIATIDQLLFQGFGPVDLGININNYQK